MNNWEECGSLCHDSTGSKETQMAPLNCCRISEIQNVEMNYSFFQQENFSNYI